MMNSRLTKAIFISLLGHITAFGIFSFSFGNRIPPANYANVSFWGAFLNNQDLLPGLKQGRHFVSINNATDTVRLSRNNNYYQLLSGYSLKPQCPLEISNNKMVFSPPIVSGPFINKRKEPVIMFYPPLPAHFLLYFKDRQAVHIELMFNIVSSDLKKSSVVIKRKISSGNLEADLLSLRYISHYLFIQQARFTPDNWQTVKIDLRAKGD